MTETERDFEVWMSVLSGHGEQKGGLEKMSEALNMDLAAGVFSFHILSLCFWVGFFFLVWVFGFFCFF